MAEYKQWRNENRTCLKDVIPLDQPYNVCIETSTLCNLNCVYCGHSKHLYPERNMSMELFEKIVEELKEFHEPLKKVELYFFGEPLCNPNLPQMIKILRESGVSKTIDFTTNGLLLTKDKVDELVANGMPDTIRISLQGLDVDAYKNIAGAQVDFSKMLDNFKYLYEHKGQCKISMKIADIAIKNIKDGEKIFKEIFSPVADTIFIESIIPIYGDVEYSKIDEEIIDNAINGREKVLQTRMNKVCHRPFYRLAVRENGDVTAACCDQLHDIKFGNINEESLITIWNGKRRNEFLKMQLRGERFKHPYCKDCIMPNDITTEDDLLDPWAEEILSRLENV